MLQIFAFLVLLVRLQAFPGQDTNFKDLKFIFINGTDTKPFEYIQLNETQKLLNHPKYDKDRPTMLYGYGYTEKYTSNSTQTVVRSYIQRADHNILVIEWSNYSGGSYLFEAIPNSYKVGEIVGKVLLNMQSSGFNLETFHLVGHSLGGHLVGFIGRSVQNNSNNATKIKRITSLDPAGPFFYGVGSMFQRPINKNDGIFVDVIHTDRTFFGSPAEGGTADWWPNDGTDQPNCPPANWDVYNENNFCSHRRSWHFYAESIRSQSGQSFPSVSCQSWRNFTENSCAPDVTGVQAFMGIDADPRLVGNYFLQTGGSSPYDLGEQGTSYKAPAQAKKLIQI